MQKNGSFVFDILVPISAHLGLTALGVCDVVQKRLGICVLPETARVGHHSTLGTTQRVIITHFTTSL
jgi:hypothetical protein